MFKAVSFQVVLLKNIHKNKLSMNTKIAIKVNFKIGGAPLLVTTPKRNMTIVDIGVSHNLQQLTKVFVKYTHFDRWYSYLLLFARLNLLTVDPKTMLLLDHCRRYDSAALFCTPGDRLCHTLFSFLEFDIFF